MSLHDGEMHALGLDAGGCFALFSFQSCCRHCFAALYACYVACCMGLLVLCFVTMLIAMHDVGAAMRA